MKKNSEDGQSSQSSLAESLSDLGSNSLEQALAGSRACLRRGALWVRKASRARSAPPLSVLSWGVAWNASRAGGRNGSLETKEKS